ncbi:hypothetical protein SZ64_09985 [Erythrobacter sp. SG61-1L]|uniref:hypothetical protein n=1 Tax=Erythrobacter sp. SG61-1L TaxID=1603897 RepID=UPI0006C928AE|nr:hypothetical protein [Erythrobacter sp. SG61-1L]KPL68419.1 hypothetical protein SZ64_09985 [Erythrobacter sp. SG61-1L]
MKKIALLCSPLLLAACGGGSEESSTGAPDATSSVAVAAESVQPTITTREGAEQAYKCRGLTSAAAAAKIALPADQVPAELSALSTGVSSYWNKQLGAIAPGVLSVDEEASLMASSTRVLATRQALEEEKDAILECIAAMPKA